MSVLFWIVLGGVMMSALSFSGALTLVFSEVTLQRLLPPGGRLARRRRRALAS